MDCKHENTFLIKDMPMVDEEFAFIGRFDIVRCEDCAETLSQTPTEEPPPVLTPGRDIIPE